MVFSDTFHLKRMSAGTSKSICGCSASPLTAHVHAADGVSARYGHRWCSCAYESHGSLSVYEPWVAKCVLLTLFAPKIKILGKIATHAKRAWLEPVSNGYYKRSAFPLSNFYRHEGLWIGSWWVGQTLPTNYLSNQRPASITATPSR